MRRRRLLGLSALALAGSFSVGLPLAPAGAADPLAARIDFQPTASPVATGYTADTGLGFDAGRGSGWIAASAATPLDLRAQTRDRDLTSDRRLDTLIQAQPATGAGRWEMVVPNGTYDVRVGVGDARYLDSSHRVLVEGAVAVDTFVPTNATKFRDASVRVTVTDGRVTVDPTTGTNTKLTFLTIDEVPAPPLDSTHRVNFQPEATTPPAGYARDWGQGFDAGRGYGWVAQGSATPVSLVGQTRERVTSSELRLDTLVQAQQAGGITGRWEHVVPSGTYDVTVSAGDPSYTDSTHRVRVEGTLAISNFVPSAGSRTRQATVRVPVTDGRVTLDLAGGTNTKLNYVDITPVATPSPTIVSTTPAAGATGVPLDTSVTLFPSESVDPTTVNATTFTVTAPGGTAVPGYYNTDAAGGVLAFTPGDTLAANTTYAVALTAGVRDLDGIAFTPTSFSFTTGASTSIPDLGLTFDRTTVGAVTGPSAMVMGPDGKLYVANGIGEIRRYTLGADGLPTGAPQVMRPLGTMTRTITGLHFDPAATASNLRLWVSHGELGFEDMANFTGKISLLTGTSLATVTDKVVGLPRSVHDHMNNGIDVGPDGRLYVSVGSMSGYGAPDDYWGNRPEVPLGAAVLAVDLAHAAFAGAASVDVNTSTGYDPDAANAPVTVYADGLRNAYDLLWHPNGSLYTGGNESAGGNTPAGPNGTPPALVDLPAGSDFFTRVVQGGYYGHPNPSRGHYVLNGGNPTASTDAFEVPQYVVGTQPDPAWVRPLANLGKNRSPNGLDLYTSDAYGSALAGKVLLAEFSNGDDVIALTLDGSGGVASRALVAGGFYNPLDVLALPDGRIYVAEYGEQPSGAGGVVTLLSKPGTTPPPADGTVRVNFQNETAAVPTGYRRDFGQAFDATRGYGWVGLTSSTPVSLVGNGRERSLASDQRLDTFVHMQFSGSAANGVATPGRWEHVVPNGTYDVTVAAGDPGTAVDSVHRVTVEGVQALSFTPTSTNRQRSATVRVGVTDGRVTLDPTGGSNTKVDHVDITPVDAPPPVDTTDPTVAAVASGTAASGGFANSAQVTISASDLGSGIASVTYRLDGGAATPYTAPFTVTGAGSHTVVATATDVAGNDATDTETFTIVTVAGSGTIAVDGLDTFLGNGDRLVFSTVDEQALPGRVITVRNAGSSPLNVTNMAMSGNQASNFRLAAGTPTSYTLAPGASRAVTVEFRLSSFLIISNAALTITSSDPARGTFRIDLSGLDAFAFEGSNEPQLGQIAKVLGYTTTIGFTAPNTQITRDPVGDEVVSQHWARADTSKPVQLIPVARYVSRTEAPSGFTSWRTKTGTTNTRLYDFAGGDITQYGGENQKLLPVPTGSATFNPGSAFTLGMYFNEYSDDGLNSTKTHNFRFYPAEDPNGNVIANTWIVGHDKALTGKNFDYQDEVFVLVNARPELTEEALPGAAALRHDFASSAGGVLDADGQGTGFASVLTNTAGNQLNAAKLDVATGGAGLLRVTSDPGTYSGSGNTQRNALFDPFTAVRGDVAVTARIQGPLAMTTPQQHQGIWFGPDQDNYFKWEVEFRNGAPHFVVFFEQGGTGRLVGTPLAVPNPGAVSTIDLRITGDLGAGTLTASYRINSDTGAFTTFATPQAPSAVMTWFSRASKAGIVVSNEGTSRTFTGAFDSFATTGA